MRLAGRSLVCAALLAPFISAASAPAAEPAAEPAAPTAEFRISGRWTGSKLRCQKEEGKLVRCGTPLPFEIAFAEDGSGTTSDENLPGEFSWRWSAPEEIILTPKAGGREIRLFGVEHEAESSMTFQAYIFLPPVDPEAPAGTRYIHYIFDVNRAQQ